MKDLKSLFNKSLITRELEPSLKTCFFNLANKKSAKVYDYDNQSSLVLASYMHDYIQNNWLHLNIDDIENSLDDLLIESLVNYKI
jgi:hypothetical protein